MREEKKEGREGERRTEREELNLPVNSIQSLNKPNRKEIKSRRNQTSYTRICFFVKLFSKI